MQCVANSNPTATSLRPTQAARTARYRDPGSTGQSAGASTGHSERRTTSAPAVGAVRTAGVHMQLDGGADGGQPAGVFDVLVAEDVQLADFQVRRDERGRRIARRPPSRDRHTPPSPRPSPRASSSSRWPSSLPNCLWLSSLPNCLLYSACPSLDRPRRRAAPGPGPGRADAPLPSAPVIAVNGVVSPCHRYSASGDAP